MTPTDFDDDARAALRNAQMLQRRRCLALLMIAALCWGIGNVPSKTVLDHLHPVVVAGLRCVMTPLLALALLTEPPSPRIVVAAPLTLAGAALMGGPGTAT